MPRAEKRMFQDRRCDPGHRVPGTWEPLKSQGAVIVGVPISQMSWDQGTSQRSPPRVSGEYHLCWNQPRLQGLRTH